MEYGGSKNVNHDNLAPDRVSTTEFMKHEEGSVSHSTAKSGLFLLCRSKF